MLDKINYSLYLTLQETPAVSIEDFYVSEKEKTNKYCIDLNFSIRDTVIGGNSNIDLIKSRFATKCTVFAVNNEKAFNLITRENYKEHLNSHSIVYKRVIDIAIKDRIENTEYFFETDHVIFPGDKTPKKIKQLEVKYGIKNPHKSVIVSRYFYKPKLILNKYNFIGVFVVFEADKSIYPASIHSHKLISNSKINNRADIFVDISGQRLLNVYNEGIVRPDMNIANSYGIKLLSPQIKSIKKTTEMPIIEDIYKIIEPVAPIEKTKDKKYTDLYHFVDTDNNHCYIYGIDIGKLMNSSDIASLNVNQKLLYVSRTTGRKYELDNISIQKFANVQASNTGMIFYEAKDHDKLKSLINGDYNLEILLDITSHDTHTKSSHIFSHIISTDNYIAGLQYILARNIDISVITSGILSDFLTPIHFSHIDEVYNFKQTLDSSGAKKYIREIGKKLFDKYLNDHVFFMTEDSPSKDKNPQLKQTIFKVIDNKEKTKAPHASQPQQADLKKDNIDLLEIDNFFILKIGKFIQYFRSPETKTIYSVDTDTSNIINYSRFPNIQSIVSILNNMSDDKLNSIANSIAPDIQQDKKGYIKQQVVETVISDLYNNFGFDPYFYKDTYSLISVLLKWGNVARLEVLKSFNNGIEEWVALSNMKSLKGSMPTGQTYIFRLRPVDLYDFGLVSDPQLRFNIYNQYFALST